MPLQPLAAVLEILARDSRPRRGATSTLSLLLDLLHFGEFEVYEQVSSYGRADFVNLAGFKGRGDATEALWLVSCVSTGADPVPARWRSTGGNPLGPRVDRATGLVHGLGAASGKVDLVLKLLAASRFMRDELARPLAVIALFGEEAAGTGMRALLEGQPKGPGAAVFDAPTNLELWAAHPGLVGVRVEIARRVRYRRMPPFRGVFEVTVRGRSAHALAPLEGPDALARGLEALDALRAAGDARVLAFESGEGSNRTAGHCKMTVATSYASPPPLPGAVHIEALADGTPVPFPVDELLDAWFVARAAGLAAVEALLAERGADLLPTPRSRASAGAVATDRDAVTGALSLWRGAGASTEEICETLAGAMQRALAGREELELAIQVVQDRPAFAAAAPGQESGLIGLARGALRASGLPAAVTSGLATTDAGLLAARGTPALVFGPGRGLHDLYRDDEAVPIAHIEAAVGFYEKLIAAWCLAPPANPA